MHELVKRCSHFSMLRTHGFWGATLVAVKNLPANVRNIGSIPGLGRYTLGSN